MKKTTLAVTLILALLSSATAAANLSLLAKANPEVYAIMPRGYIHSPIDNKTYHSSFIPLSLTVEVSKDTYNNASSPSILCYFDGKPLRVNTIPKGANAEGWLVFEGQTTVRNVADGKHSLAIADISCSWMASLVFPSVEFSVARPAPIANTQSSLAMSLSTLTAVAVSLALATVTVVGVLVHKKRRH
jgi:hypothetical protein